MKRKKNDFKCLVGDFETTVYDGQTRTEVWASAFVQLETEDVVIFNSLPASLKYIQSLDCDLDIYYHNLKFDGTFWLYYLIQVLHFKQAGIMDDNGILIDWQKDDDMEDNSVKYLISAQGQWYTITIKTCGHLIHLKDSYKLLPCSVKKLGESFGTKHRKSSIEYTGYRKAGGVITDEEKKYIANDVLVVKEALEIMFQQGHNKLTIGSCCLAEYKRLLTNQFHIDGARDTIWDEYFPDLTKFALDEKEFGSKDADTYIRKSYKGGWCYLVKGKENKVFHDGITADVNSLYPSVMHSDSGNYYPVGKPVFYKGRIPDFGLLEDERFYFIIRFKCRFFLKSLMLPTVQIKNNIFYRANEWLDRSDFYSKKDDKYYPELVSKDGLTVTAKPTMTMTGTDFLLFMQHYDIYDIEYLDYCRFNTVKGLFDEYIDKYKEIKMNSKGATREIAKLFLNNLYGKMATNRISSFKYVNEEVTDHLSFIGTAKDDKPVVYIPCGTAITSYARKFTITAAQNNYYGANSRGFIYADTDSIHCDLTAKELIGVPVHKSDFCHWKLETQWDKAIFTRQKTYIEHIIGENLEPIEEPYHNVKCAGMPDACKWQLECSFEHKDKAYWQEKLGEVWYMLNKEQQTFICTPREYEDFKVGLHIFGKLVPVQIQGGTLLMETSYEMR